MSVRSKIIASLEDLYIEDSLTVPIFADDLVLLETDLDSLGFAVLVSRLEDELGFDPFSLMEEAVYPETLGHLVEIYERCVNDHESPSEAS